MDVIPTCPTITFDTVVPIPTDFTPSKYSICGNAILTFSIFLDTGYVNFVSNLETNVPALWVPTFESLYPLLTLCLLLTSS